MEDGQTGLSRVASDGGPVESGRSDHAWQARAQARGTAAKWASVLAHAGENSARNLPAVTPALNARLQGLAHIPGEAAIATP